MNTDVKTLLDRAANDGHPIDRLIDAAADLRRAQRHVHRRRSATVGAAAATLLCAALVPVGFHVYGGDGVAPQTPSSAANGSIVVAPKRGADPNPRLVEDKIEVSVYNDPDLDSIRSVPPPGEDKKWKAEGNSVVRIHGREGYIHGSDMDFQASNGRWIHIQLP